MTYFNNLIPVAVVVVAILVVLSRAIRILREYERGVVFQLGRFWRVKGPGLILLFPIVQQMVRLDLRTRVLDVPSQDVIYYRIVDPERATIQVEDFNMATSQLAQTTLRSVLGQHDLDQMLAERDKLNADIQKSLDNQTESWGIKVSNVELKQVDLNETMIRAIAKQAEAERLRRAKVIDAEGELQASEKLAQAAEVLSRKPQAMQLRYLTTVLNIAGDKTSTIIFPLPIDVLEAFRSSKQSG